MCNNKQVIKTREKVWDDKFGMIEREVPVYDCIWYKDGYCGYASPDTIGKCIHPDNQKDCLCFQSKTLYAKAANNGVVVQGVGKDAPIVTNEKGGKQAQAPMAMHLLDPDYLAEWAEDMREAAEDSVTYHYTNAIYWIAEFMKYRTTCNLGMAMDNLAEDNYQQITRIAKVLQEGAAKYAPNNWRLIPREEHINHALIHIIAHLMGDTQDEHINHALARLMMAQATQESEGFSYTKCISDMTKQTV